MLQGRLVRDPEISPKHADDPKKMNCIFTIAVRRDFIRDDRPDTDFFRCIAFGSSASYLVRKGRKGGRILVEGRVEFSNSSMSLTMRPGEVLSYGTATGNVSTWSENVNQHLSWMSGHLNYDRISLERLMVRLSSIYDMDIRYSPVKYADSSFRISLNTKEPIENVLQAIATLTPIEWQRDGNVISIKEK